MGKKTICILGGTGFVGTHIACRLSRDGHRLIVPTRHRELKRHLLVLPKLELLQTDIRDPAALEARLAGCDAAINLVGILNEKGDDGSGFHEAHVAVTQRLIAACERTGVKRLLHMSALNAAPDAPSHYLRSKAQAEECVRAAGAGELRWSIFRPSVIFGPEDEFLNRFAKLLQMTPLVFPLACADSRFAPVYVGDVAEAFARALDDPDTYDQTYELCGPKSYSLGELVAYTARLLGLKRSVVALPDWAARVQARLLEFVPGKPFSRDNYRSLQIDSVCRGDSGLARLGIGPTPLESQAPMYLPGPRPGGRYGLARAHARRSGR